MARGTEITLQMDQCICLAPPALLSGGTLRTMNWELGTGNHEP
jgi:hypothetical protein